MHVDELPVDTYPMLSGAELRAIVDAVAAEDALTVEETARFLAADPKHRSRMVDVAASAIPTGLFLGAWGIEIANTDLGSGMPTWGHVPHLVQSVVKATSDLLPVSYDIDDSTAVSKVLPDAMLEGSFLTSLYAFKRIAGAIVRNPRRLDSMAQAAQDKLREQVVQGINSYRFSGPDGVVAFTGNGTEWPVTDMTGTPIDYPEILQVAYEPGNGIGTVLPPTAGRAEIAAAVQRVDVVHALGGLLFPEGPKKGYLASPDSEDKDFSVNRMHTYIRATDQAREDAGVAPMPFVIVGTEDQKTESLTATHSSEKYPNPDIERLDDHMQEFALVRGAPIVTLDTTDFVNHVIDVIADGRLLALTADPQKMPLFGARFFETSRERTISDYDGEAIRVVYDAGNDRFTTAVAKPGDIAVINDSHRREDLQAAGVPDDHILVPSEITTPAALQMLRDLATRIA